MKCVFLLLLPCLALATDYGSLEGTVVDDSTGEPMPGALIVLWQQGNPTDYGADADATGRYEIINIPPGCYDVECCFMGHNTRRATSVIIQDQTKVVDFRLSAKVLLSGANVELPAKKVELVNIGEHWYPQGPPTDPEEPQGRQPDSLRLELAFDGEVPYEYNRWLKENKREFPRLWPVFIVLDSSVHRDTLASFYVSYYDENGNTRAHRKHSGLRRGHWQPGGGREFDVKVAPRADRLLVIDHRDVWSSFDIVTTVLDSREDTVFVSNGGTLVYGEGPLYFRFFLDEEGVPERDYFEVLDDSGRILNRVHLRGAVGHVHAARNGTHIVRAEDCAVAVDRHGEVVWLDTIPGICETNVGYNGWTAAGLNLTWMRVKNFATGEVFEAYLAGHEGQRYAKPSVAIAERRGGLMVHRPHSSRHSEGLDVFYTHDCHQVGKPVASVGGTPREAYCGGGIGLMVLEDNRLVIARPDWPVEVHEGIGFQESRVVLDGSMVAFIGSKRAMVYRIGRHE